MNYQYRDYRQYRSQTLSTEGIESNQNLNLNRQSSRVAPLNSQQFGNSNTQPIEYQQIVQSSYSNFKEIDKKLDEYNQKQDFKTPIKKVQNNLNNKKQSHQIFYKLTFKKIDQNDQILQDLREFQQIDSQLEQQNQQQFFQLIIEKQIIENQYISINGISINVTNLQTIDEFLQQIKQSYDIQQNRNLLVQFNNIVDNPQLILYYLNDFAIRQVTFFNQETSFEFETYILYLLFIESYDKESKNSINKIIIKNDEEIQNLDENQKLIKSLETFYLNICEYKIFFENLFKIDLIFNQNIDQQYKQKIQQIKAKIQRQIMSQNMICFFDQNSDNVSQQNFDNDNRNHTEQTLLHKLNQYNIYLQYDQQQQQNINQNNIEVNIENKSNDLLNLFCLNVSESELKQLIGKDQLPFIKCFLYYYFILCVIQIFAPAFAILHIYKNWRRKEFTTFCIQFFVCISIWIFFSVLNGSLFVCLYFYYDLDPKQKNLTTYYLLQFIFCQGMIVITQLIDLIKKYQDNNLLRSDFIDVMNDLDICQMTYYIEFLDNFNDKYMKKMLPQIPKNQQTVNKLGLNIADYIMKSQQEDYINKKWVPASLIYQRYIDSPYIVTSKILNNDENLKKKNQFQKKYAGRLLDWIIFKDDKKSIHAFWFLIRVIILPFLTVFGCSLQDFKTWIVFGMSLTEGMQFYFLAYESSLKGGQQEKQEINLKINKVMNLITKHEINGQLRDIPVINIFDITSMESWQNIFKLTQSNIKTYNSIKDVATSFYGFAAIIYFIFFIFDIFGTLWEKNSLIHYNHYKILVFYLIDFMIIFYIVGQDLSIKVKFNSFYDQVIQEIESKISLVQDIANNIYENFSIYSIEINQDLTYRQAVEDNQRGDAYHIQMKLCKHELIRHAKLRLILKGVQVENLDKDQFLIHVKEYANDLISKYQQIKKETDQESNNNPQKFLGCIKVDAKLINQLIIGLFIGIVGSFGQILLQSLYEQ